MTFYEELGVPPDAAPATIRDAYRKVARLLHPDVQTDPLLKESAETQMKRINHLYGVLSDPERRRRYDLELAASVARPAAIFIAAPLPAERPLRTGYRDTLVWLTATAVCAAFIVWLAARESSATPAVYPILSSAVPSAAPSKPLVRHRTQAAGVLPTVVPAQGQPAQQRDEELAALRGQLLAAKTERERIEKELAARDAERKAAYPAIDTPAPLVAAQPATEISLPPVLHAAAPPTPPKVAAALPVEPAAPIIRWTGAWVYREGRADKHDKNDKGLLPPEFIEAVITEDKGRIRGRYHARFKVADAGISPDVDFHFEGRVSGPAGSLAWAGNGGAKGAVRLHLLSNGTLEIVWSATNLGKSMGLASGTAVLNRRN